MTGAKPPMPAALTELASLIRQADGFDAVVEALHDGQSAAIDGAWGSSCALVAAALRQACPDHTLLVVVPAVREVDDFAEDLSEFTGTETLSFPAWETLPDEHTISDAVFSTRLSVLQSLEDPLTPPTVVTSLPALMQPVPSVEAIREATREIRTGDELDVGALTAWLGERGFERVTAVELPGEFRLHGGILDIYPPTESDPVRIELFGDQVESIRRFDVETQRRRDDLARTRISAPQPVTPASVTNSAPSGSLADGLPGRSIVLFQDLNAVRSEGRLYLQRLENPVGLFRPEAVLARLTEFPSVTIDTLAADSCETTCHLPIEPAGRFSHAGQDALCDLSESLGPSERLMLCCHNEGEQRRLEELFAERDEQFRLLSRTRLCIGRIRSGFRLRQHELTVVSDNELFARSRSPKRMRRRPDARAIDSFLDLREGDLVVHVAHGIARYRGMRLTEKDGEREEHLLLEFRDGVLVYVPATLIHLVQKYIGPAKKTPQLSKFGGTAWGKKKAQVQTAVSDMAADMLKLQADRCASPGLQCGPDSVMQEEFEQAFPFAETPDQLSAIADIRSDMEQPRPMDRLICGDVGFGKTEVAMRAAFKCVDNGRQVAVLVPTTVLAEQHYRTFSERMAEFPVHVEMLSRFRSPARQKQILRELRDGNIDILIGTHRLVSRDVQFRDLGLLIIDEEQKFGVQVKERLKHLRLEVDVLTLTATPIPRTLHMSLLGIRDISSLTTPPRDRVPIETRVGRFDESLIRSAVIRELNRGGQVYFVHNRVHDIDEVADRIRNIVPEATLAVAHGQMPEEELETAMLKFVRGEVDILLATTIIESGLDIPNANTMIIHQAEIFGLADLHQLRGRVGRDRHRAYCYLMLDEDRVVTDQAARRLRAIEEYSELGSGFRIAMRDLEIRGAGNILGTEQSGNIAAVGYELYCQLLENAVRSLRNQPLRQPMHVRTDLPVSSFLPDRYIPDQKLKIDIYRRLSQTNSLEALAELEEELRDRFGPIPAAAGRMLQLRELNLRALSWRIEGIHLEDDYAVLRYRDARMIHMLSHLHDRQLRIVDQHDAYWPLQNDAQDGASVLEELLKVLSAAEPPLPENEPSPENSAVSL